MLSLKYWFFSAFVFNLLFTAIYFVVNSDFSIFQNMRISDIIYMINNFNFSQFQTDHNHFNYWLILNVIVNFYLALFFSGRRKEINMSNALSINTIIKKHEMDNSSKHYGYFYLPSYKVFFNPFYAESEINFFNMVSVNPESFTSKKELIKLYLKISEADDIDFVFSRKIVTIKLNKLPTYLEYQDDSVLPKKDEEKIYLGQSYNGEPFYIKPYHLLSNGLSGGGKSTSLHITLKSILRFAEFTYLTDFKGLELVDYADNENVKFTDEFEKLDEYLDEVIEIFKKRKEYMLSKRLKKYDGGHIFIIIDEAASLAQIKDKKLKESIFDKLLTISRLGRGYQLWLQVYYQKADAVVGNVHLFENLSQKLLFKSKSDYSVNMCFGTREELRGFTSLPLMKFPSGRAIFTDEKGNSTLIQVPFVEV